ncbi:hypothetical protein [Paraflavitalea speifideaquila]|nr:hypothetical protein [Paraflavitalea speifideiaquila]
MEVSPAPCLMGGLGLGLLIPPYYSLPSPNILSKTSTATINAGHGVNF